MRISYPASSTAWAYCHVPHGSDFGMTDRIEAQMERFAPGFKDCVLARHTRTAIEMQTYNPNYVGGDINGGVQDFAQLVTRPALQFPPYATPAEGIYICSSATPPGGGVHGMCGYFAALTALKELGAPMFGGPVSLALRDAQVLGIGGEIRNGVSGLASVMGLGEMIQAAIDHL